MLELIIAIVVALLIVNALKNPVFVVWLLLTFAWLYFGFADWIYWCSIGALILLALLGQYGLYLERKESTDE